MGGGITPKAQPLDALVNKIFKGFYRDNYDEYILSAPVNEKTGHPIPPSRQLMACWIVDAWGKVPCSLVTRSWIVCGYPSYTDLHVNINDSKITKSHIMNSDEDYIND